MPALLPIAAICSPLFAFLLAIQLYSSKRPALPTALAIGLAMAALGFGLYSTNQYNDLATYSAMTLTTQGLSLRQSIDLFSSSHMSDTPLGIAWFWLVGRTGNPQVYPATIAFVEYSILAYILTDAAAEAKVSRHEYAVLLLFLLVATPIFDSVNSVRSTPSMAVGALAIYLEHYKKRCLPIAVLCYCLSPLIHSAGFIVFPMRIMCSVARRSIPLAITGGILLLPVAYLLADIADPILSSFGLSVASKVRTYVGGGSSAYTDHVVRQTFYHVRKWVTFALMAIACFEVSKWLRKRDADEPDGMRGIAEIGLAYAAITMGFVLFVTAPTYARFTYVAVPFLGIATIHGMMSHGFRGNIRSVPGFGLHEFLCVVAFIGFVALSLVNMARRVDLMAFVCHLVFGFFGALFI